MPTCEPKPFPIKALQAARAHEFELCRSSSKMPSSTARPAGLVPNQRPSYGCGTLQSYGSKKKTAVEVPQLEGMKGWPHVFLLLLLRVQHWD